MAIIYPSEEISRRWSGALQTKLRRAPLERFLRAHGIAPALTGPSEVSDNLARGTVLIVESALLPYCCSHGQPPHEIRHAAVGHVACVVSRALAAGISEASAWRVAALLGATQLLRPHVGLTAAAIAAAILVRCHEQGISRSTHALDAEIRDSVSVALNDNSTAAVAKISALIGLSLAIDNAEDPQRQPSAGH